jgi:hypothetical protein
MDSLKMWSGSLRHAPAAAAGCAGFSVCAIANGASPRNARKIGKKQVWREMGFIKKLDLTCRNVSILQQIAGSSSCRLLNG